MQSTHTSYPGSWQRRLNGRKPVWGGHSEGGAQQTQGGLNAEPQREAPGLSAATPPHQSKQPRQSVSCNARQCVMFNTAADAAWLRTLLAHLGGENITLRGSAGLTPLMLNQDDLLRSPWKDITQVQRASCQWRCRNWTRIWTYQGMAVAVTHQT